MRSSQSNPGRFDLPGLSFFGGGRCSAFPLLFQAEFSNFSNFEVVYSGPPNRGGLYSGGMKNPCNISYSRPSKWGGLFTPEQGWGVSLKRQGCNKSASFDAKLAK